MYFARQVESVEGDLLPTKRGGGKEAKAWKRVGFWHHPKYWHFPAQSIRLMALDLQQSLAGRTSRREHQLIWGKVNQKKIILMFHKKDRRAGGWPV
jgi:hypothetical protein